MPVRILDISKKLGLENREIIAKAKSLGIAAAKVPSSSLDKISAEWLEEELLKDYPEVAARLASKPVEQKTRVIHAAPPAVATSVPATSGVADLTYPLVSVVLPSSDQVTSSVLKKMSAAIPLTNINFKAPKTLSPILTKIENHRLHQQRAVGGRHYSPKAFENDVNRLMDELFPFSVLPGIRLFSTEPRGKIDYGFEMDNLIHVRFEGIDYLVEIEAKHQPVLADKGRWLVKYEAESSCAREQVDNHIRTMWEYLKPVARQIELKFLAVVVSSDPGTARKKTAGYRNAELHLCSVQDLPALLAEKFNFNLDSNLPAPEVLRVSQSGFLDLLRLSLPVKELGHPELASAIRYVDRCRRTLDETLFQKFDPSRDLWAINGSAGMGKSVLLAYTAAVLSSGHELYRFAGEVGVKKAADTFTKIGFNADPKKGSIIIMAMSAKQLENIRGWFNLFMEQFQKADYSGDVRFRPPEFVLCRPGVSFSGLAEKCSALLVDEAHDIPQFAARELVEIHQKNGIYLVVACDRHQKLRLAGADAKIIEGLDFTNRSTRLRQIYRNPAPVYLASLAIMFRWFAESGPKVIPSNTQLDEQFGLETVSQADGLEVTMRSDAHPANSWCHTVASFPDCASAFAALVKENLKHKDVLWVRFSEEDPDFDYEQLIRHFTYHDCRSHDAQKISDKYIKGQDYPIVIIEGFPGFMDRYDAPAGQDAAAPENHMWAFRRELYLCASRATAFLYFICDVTETPEVLRIRAEIQRLVSALAVPEGLNHGGTKSWKFFIDKTVQTRNLDVFTDAVPAATNGAASTLTGGLARPTPPENIIGQKTENIKAVTSIVTEPSPTQTPPPAPELIALGKAANISPLEPANLSVNSIATPAAPTDQKPPHTNLPDNQIRLVKTPSPAPPSLPESGDGQNAPPKVHSNPNTIIQRPLKPTTSSNAIPFDAETKSEQNLTLASLGEVATLFEVAKCLGKDIAELRAKMTSRGFSNVAPNAKVNVKFVVGLFKESSSVPNKPDLSPRTRPPQEHKAPNKPILELPEQMTVRELADALNQKPFKIVADLMGANVFATVNQPIGFELITKIASRYGFTTKRKA
jgi:hypothetical protein